LQSSPTLRSTRLRSAGRWVIRFVEPGGDAALLDGCQEVGDLLVSFLDRRKATGERRREVLEIAPHGADDLRDLIL
jgi:hypothetical protein